MAEEEAPEICLLSEIMIALAESIWYYCFRNLESIDSLKIPDLDSNLVKSSQFLLLPCSCPFPPFSPTVGAVSLFLQQFTQIAGDRVSKEDPASECQDLCCDL